MAPLAALSLLVAGVCVAPSAQAYCRTRTCEFRPDQDCQVEQQSGCSTVGQFVYWDSRCIPYAVQRDGSEDEGITAEALDALVADGFELWSNVSCADGNTPELSAASQGPIACDQVEYDCNVREDNSNLIVFRDDFVNTAFGLRFGVIALTTLTANLVSGELFDADIEINSRDEDFEVTATGGGVGPNEPRDLRGVVNHELGHLLGLSHSEETGALMRAAYEGTFTPGADDAAAMCAALGTSDGDPECSARQLGEDFACLGGDTTCTSQPSAQTVQDGCSCEVVGGPEPRSGRGIGLVLLTLGAAWRLARRRSRVAS